MYRVHTKMLLLGPTANDQTLPLQIGNQTDCDRGNEWKIKHQLYSTVCLNVNMFTDCVINWGIFLVLLIQSVTCDGCRPC